MLKIVSTTKVPDRRPPKRCDVVKQGTECWTGVAVVEHGRSPLPGPVRDVVLAQQPPACRCGSGGRCRPWGDDEIAPGAHLVEPAPAPPPAPSSLSWIAEKVDEDGGEREFRDRDACDQSQDHAVSAQLFWRTGDEDPSNKPRARRQRVIEATASTGRDQETAGDHLRHGAGGGFFFSPGGVKAVRTGPKVPLAMFRR